jgi:hypothetical protein
VLIGGGGKRDLCQESEILRHVLISVRPEVSVNELPANRSFHRSAGKLSRAALWLELENMKAS